MLKSSFVWVTWPFIAKTGGAVGVIVAILTLAETREKLLSENIFDTTESYDSEISCGARTLEARTEDGTCNSLAVPQMGAAGVRFGRNVPLSETQGETGAQLLTPNPRTISRELLGRDTFKPATTLNFIAAAWIQFMVHDWVSHGPNADGDPIRVPLAADDPFGQAELLVKRTRPDAQPSSGPAAYRNENTHWWDGSQLYGSNRETNNKVRTFVDGKLKLDGKQRLPTQWDGVPVTGFNENWWLGLSMLHHIFTLEHNAIATRLKEIHPDWDDQKLYDKARLINAALMAKIHTVEWTPAILANPVLKTAMNANWFGLLGKKGQKPFQTVIEGIGTHLALIDGAVEAQTGADPQLREKFQKTGVIERTVGGIVGSQSTALYGVPYTLTEEFTAVYRMHPLLRDAVNIFDYKTGDEKASIPLENTRNSDAEAIMGHYSQGDLWYSFGATHPGALTLKNYPRFLQNLSIPLVGNIDLATIDIVRDRERGVPRYNSFRRLLHLKPISSFEQLTQDPDLLVRLKRIYQNDVEQLDLLVGSLAETVRPDGFGFGETSFQIFILNASRRLMADRFYTSDFRPEVYTQEGIDWVNSNSMVSVLMRHVPELRPLLEKQENAFQPWKR